MSSTNIATGQVRVPTSATGEVLVVPARTGRVEVRLTMFVNAVSIGNAGVTVATGYIPNNEANAGAVTVSFFTEAEIHAVAIGGNAVTVSYIEFF